MHPPQRTTPFHRSLQRPKQVVCSALYSLHRRDVVSYSSSVIVGTIKSVNGLTPSRQLAQACSLPPTFDASRGPMSSLLANRAASLTSLRQRAASLTSLRQAHAARICFCTVRRNNPRVPVHRPYPIARGVDPVALLLSQAPQEAVPPRATPHHARTPSEPRALSVHDHFQDEAQIVDKCPPRPPPEPDVTKLSTRKANSPLSDNAYWPTLRRRYVLSDRLLLSPCHRNHRKFRAHTRTACSAS